MACFLPATQTAACNALHDIASRMSRWLLQTSDKIEDDTIPFTRDFLGKMLGVHRGTISLVATQFEVAGLIHTHRGKIELLDKKGLKNEACACYELRQCCGFGNRPDVQANPAARADRGGGAGGAVEIRRAARAARSRARE
jgi:hypothetical protein